MRARFRPRAHNGADGKHENAHTAVQRWLPAAAGSALALVGLSRRSPAGAALAMAGGALAYAGSRGQAGLPEWLRIGSTQQGGDGLTVRQGITILRSREELYSTWRDVGNLPRFMRFVQSVEMLDERRSRWLAAGPAGTTAQWDMEITEDRPNELICWHSLPGTPVPNRGEVRFQPAPGGRGTEVRLVLDFDPPSRELGATLGDVLGEATHRVVLESLRNFKRLMETGEIPRNDPQPMGTCPKA
jgi:uncharacterized membrane protein